MRILTCSGKRSTTRVLGSLQPTGTAGGDHILEILSEVQKPSSLPLSLLICCPLCMSNLIPCGHADECLAIFIGASRSEPHLGLHVFVCTCAEFAKARPKDVLHQFNSYNFVYLCNMNEAENQTVLRKFH